MAKTVAAAPEDRVRLYEALIATLPGVERKGAKLPYTSLNGNMFSILSAKGVMGLRLSKADREAFLADQGASLYADYGTVMPEYVAVPDALLADTQRMTPYMAASYAYARTLKPKPTTKPKKPKP
jgi:TfoX/Sxy family transcriptional regulator of competence genes